MILLVVVKVPQPFMFWANQTVADLSARVHLKLKGPWLLTSEGDLGRETKGSRNTVKIKKKSQSKRTGIFKWQLTNDSIWQLFLLFYVHVIARVLRISFINRKAASQLSLPGYNANRHAIRLKYSLDNSKDCTYGTVFPQLRLRAIA